MNQTRKKDVLVKTIMWHSSVTANVLFQKMPYILDRFNFIESENPDYVIFNDKARASTFPKHVVKIYMPIEHRQPALDKCDWSFTFYYDDEVKNSRHLRLPNYTRVGAGENLIKTDYDAEKIYNDKSAFCAFVYSHSTKFRDEFCKKLSIKKRVDCPGLILNNMPYLGGYSHPAQVREHLIHDIYKKHDEKVIFLKKYKFTICFENEASTCYTSEKIYHALLANSLPIYWGNTQVHKDFNTESFINLPKFNGVNEVIDYVLYLDHNKQAYIDMLSKPWYSNNRLTPFVDPQVFIDRFTQIFNR